MARDQWNIIEDDTSMLYPKTNTRIIGELTLLVEPSLYSYIKTTQSANEVWKGLEVAFSDAGVSRKVYILNQLVSMRLNNMENRNILSYLYLICIFLSFGRKIAHLQKGHFMSKPMLTSIIFY